MHSTDEVKFVYKCHDNHRKVWTFLFQIKKT